MGPTQSYSIGTRKYFLRGKTAGDMKLTTHLHTQLQWFAPSCITEYFENFRLGSQTGWEERVVSLMKNSETFPVFSIPQTLEKKPTTTVASYISYCHKHTKNNYNG
jgi:hypothetical protein